jgi:hypothetical protein
MKNSNKFIKWDEKFELLKYQTLTNEEYLERLGNLGKLGRGFMGKKADSPRNFLERNFILLLAFIFMICLANLITILFLINIFL